MESVKTRVRSEGDRTTIVTAVVICATFAIVFSTWARPSASGGAFQLHAHRGLQGSDAYEYADDAVHRELLIEQLYGIQPRPEWPDYISQLGSERIPPLTHEVQRWIHGKQNPPLAACSRQRFLLGYMVPKQGMGSSLHVAAAFLGNALQYDHIFMWNPSKAHIGEEYVDEGCGRNESYTSFDCLFERPSVCGNEHITKGNSVSKKAFTTDDYKGQLPWTRRRGPAIWEDRLRAHYSALGVEVSDVYLKVWWRSQAVAYLVRPNAPTLAAIRAMRLDPAMHQVAINGSLQAGQAVPFPLPPATISMHVRHGDKDKEMKLVLTKDYVWAAEQLAIQNPLGYKRVAFMSSEDPRVVRDALVLQIMDNGTAPDAHWVTYSSIIPRMNSGPMQQLARSGDKGGRSHLSHTWMLQLYMALECDAWIGTRNSNWNRLIDELRCTLVDKCNAPYIEVGRKKDWTDYHWRR